jgi:hypothetical protein
MTAEDGKPLELPLKNAGHFTQLGAETAELPGAF